MANKEFEWNEDYAVQASRFFKLHFGNTANITALFPSMRSHYPWAKYRPPVLDSRIPAKNNEEYHGLERHACQYYATAQYDYAYHYWLMAAAWRVQDMKANKFDDPAHNKAVSYCVRQAMFNKALHEAQGSKSTWPMPEEFGLTLDDLKKKEDKTLGQIETFMAKHAEKKE